MYPVKLYLKHLPNTVMLASALVLNIASWVWTLWQIPRTDQEIFLHYTILYGVDYIGEWWRVLNLPAIGLCILVANGALGWSLFHKDKVVGYLLNAVAVLCQVFILIAVSLLIFLNV